MGSSVFPAAGGGVNQFTQRFLSGGTFTTPSTCNSVQITLVGGGGGAGGVYTPASANVMRASGGGGGGQVIKGVFPVTPGTAYTVTIGAGGTGGNGAAAGGVGGDSSFGSLATALGGGGGAGWNQNTELRGVSRATSGGGPVGELNQAWSGAGGGAGGSAQWFILNDANSYNGFGYSQTSTNNMNAIAGGMGSQGGGKVNTTAGLPIDGFGAGGAGAFTAFSTSYPGADRGAMATFNGVAPTIQTGQTAANGGNAAANTGHGGNGAAATSNGGNMSSVGGFGGSGICIVTYWA